MIQDPVAACAALRETLRHFFAAVPNGWIRDEPEGFAAFTGVPLPTVNGVWVDSTSPRPAVVSDLLDRVAATGLAHCLQARPGATEQLNRLAEDRGMRPDEPVPLMVL